MERQTIRWVIAWGVLAAAIFFAADFFWGRIALGPAASLMIFVATAVTLVTARTVMKKFPSERRITINARRTAPFKKYLIFGGLGSVLFGFAWLMVLSRVIPESRTAVVVVFFPSFAFLALGVAAITLRVYIWFFGD